MCQVGVRCYTDSNAKLISSEKKVAKLTEQASIAEAELSVATKSGDLRQVRSLRAKVADLKARVVKAEFEVIHNRRDVDGTKTGRRKLVAEMENTTDPRQLRDLEIRLRTSEGIRLHHLNMVERNQLGITASDVIYLEPLAA